MSRYQLFQHILIFHIIVALIYFHVFVRFEFFFMTHLLLSLGIEIIETSFWNQLKIRKGRKGWKILCDSLTTFSCYFFCQEMKSCSMSHWFPVFFCLAVTVDSWGGSRACSERCTKAGSVRRQHPGMVWLKLSVSAPIYKSLL